ncbi:hypothetical protein Forpe1208_v006825 [Fusarium oxysporum f. sp. rapae]|uniref:Uncharacterized protein n=1 Tax=Fusarium oxysporum f. sp. rapae TaxID=485398 RepID=A0A8J5U971_FUSOX|nr:hypothetical protein Forpe1208_v006825 [Fusarium oxysporum f. sp. rapae]
MAEFARSKIFFYCCSAL